MSRTIYSNASSLVIQKGEKKKEKTKRGRPKRACGINMTFPLFPFQLSRAFHPFLAENSHLNQKGKPQKRDKKGEQAQRQHPSKVKSRLQVRLSQIHKLPPRVSEDQVLDTSLRIVENVLVETRDIQTAAVALRREIGSVF